MGRAERRRLEKQKGKQVKTYNLRDDLTPEQVKAYRIADNKLAELSNWDDELLKKELFELQAVDYSLEVMGFTEIDLRGTFYEDLPKAGDYYRGHVLNESTIKLLNSYALYVNDGHVQHKRFLPADKLSVGGKAKYLKNRNQKGIMLKESYVNGSFFMEKGMQDAKPRLNRLVESFLQQIGREIEGGSL